MLGGVCVNTKTEIFELMNQNPAFHLATIEGGKPKVRGMLLFRADENGILFHTGAFKDVYRQVLSCPDAELCFNSPDTQVRISGILDIVDDNTLKDEITNHPTRAFLQGWKSSVAPEDFYKQFIVFRMKNGKAVVWTMETNLAPKESIDL
jgi:uncharacterized pyridoxamine 5'-phosphate oxidase family protein